MEFLNSDNRRFFLSVDRRQLLNSTDAEDNLQMNTLWFPSFLNGVLISDRISDRNQAYRDRRRMQRKEKKLPSLLKRHNEWWKVDYSLTKVWADIDEGRKIFRECAKGLVAIPTGMVESVTRGFPYLYRKATSTTKKVKRFTRKQVH